MLVLTATKKYTKFKEIPVRKRIIEKVRDGIKLSHEENTWLNRMLSSPKVLCGMLIDALGLKREETISDKRN